MNLKELDCCGVRELSGISGYTNEAGMRKGIYDILLSHNGRIACGALVFTSVESAPTKYGDLLKNLIEEEKLGVVFMNRPFVNPNTSRLIQLYVWNLDREGITKFLAKKGLKEEGVIKEAAAKISRFTGGLRKAVTSANVRRER